MHACAERWSRCSGNRLPRQVPAEPHRRGSVLGAEANPAARSLRPSSFDRRTTAADSIGAPRRIRAEGGRCVTGRAWLPPRLNIPNWDISTASVHGTGAEVNLRSQERPLQASAEEDADRRQPDPGASRRPPQPAPVLCRQVRGRRETARRHRVHGGRRGHRVRSSGVHRSIRRVRPRVARRWHAIPRRSSVRDRARIGRSDG